MRNPTDEYGDRPSRIVNLPKADLAMLLGFSDQLPGLDADELPAIKAWIKIRQDRRHLQLGYSDFEELVREIMPKVHCYR